MVPVAVGLDPVTLSILLTVFSGFFLQTGLSEEGWYNSIESVILAATGIFSLLLLALSILGLQKNRP